MSETDKRWLKLLWFWLLTAAFAAIGIGLYWVGLSRLDVQHDLRAAAISPHDLGHAQRVAMQWRAPSSGPRLMNQIRDREPPPAGRPVWIQDHSFPLANIFDREPTPLSDGSHRGEQSPPFVVLGRGSSLATTLLRVREETIGVGAVAEAIVERIGSGTTGIMVHALDPKMPDAAHPVLIVLLATPSRESRKLAVHILGFENGSWTREGSNRLIWLEKIPLLEFPSPAAPWMRPIRVRGDEGSVARSVSDLLEVQIAAANAAQGVEAVSLAVPDEEELHRVELFVQAALTSALGRALGQAPTDSTATIGPAFDGNRIDLVAIREATPAASITFGWPVWWQRVLHGSDLWGLIQFATIAVFLMAVAWALWVSVVGPTKERLEVGAFYGFVLPSIGFVGTVVGIGQAPAKIGDVLVDDPVVQQAALRDMGASLSTAFDTTFVALVLTIVFAVLLHLIRWRGVGPRSRGSSAASKRGGGGIAPAAILFLLVASAPTARAVANQPVHLPVGEAVAKSGRWSHWEWAVCPMGSCDHTGDKKEPLSIAEAAVTDKSNTCSMILSKATVRVPYTLEAALTDIKNIDGNFDDDRYGVVVAYQDDQCLVHLSVNRGKDIALKGVDESEWYGMGMVDKAIGSLIHIPHLSPEAEEIGWERGKRTVFRVTHEKDTISYSIQIGDSPPHEGKAPSPGGGDFRVGIWNKSQALTISDVTVSGARANYRLELEEGTNPQPVLRPLFESTEANRIVLLAARLSLGDGDLAVVADDLGSPEGDPEIRWNSAADLVWRLRLAELKPAQEKVPQFSNDVLKPVRQLLRAAEEEALTSEAGLSAAQAGFAIQAFIRDAKGVWRATNSLPLESLGH